MEDNDDDDAKLEEEIEAELDKISISSLEKDDGGSDSKSETQSDDSDTDLGELPQSVLHCINIIKKKSKTAEELILQDLEDTDVLNDGEINFEYCEVEEKLRQSFEAWQDKQKELEDQEKETIKAQRDREEKQFQEEEEKRHHWMKQFEVEKRKLDSIRKQEQDKMNDELHKEEKMWKEKFKQHEEFIRNLHLQMEEERTRFKDLQKKEKMRLLKLRHDAAVKIQAKYRAFMAYQKYGPIIKEQIDNKKRKALEWKEKEAKIRQMEEEKRKRLEEEQRIEEEIKRWKQEERKRREKEYEEKKNILRQEKEQLLNKEKLRLKEDGRKQLIISGALKKGEHNAKHLNVKDTSKNNDDITKNLGDEKSKKLEDVPLWLVKEVNKRENVDRQLVLNESIQVQLEESTLNQAVLAEFKMEEKNENLAKKQCSEKLGKQERKYENIDKKTELENPDSKENMKKGFQLQELKSLIQKEASLQPVIKDNIKETQIMILGHNQIHEVKSNEAQKKIKVNQQNKIQNVEKEEMSEQNGILYGENNISVISMKQKLLPLVLENSKDIRENLILQEKEIALKSKGTEENPKGNDLNSNVIFNVSDSVINAEGKINKQNYILGRHALCKDLGGYNARSSLVFKELNSLKSQIKEIPEECHENRAESENFMTSSVPEPTLLSSIEEKRLAWIKSFKPWFEIFKQNQQKKIVKRKRLVKCPANTMAPLNTLEILQCGPWNNLQQVTTVTFQDLPGCSLSTLAECTNLQFLSLRRCGLTSLNSLSNCKKLKYIDVQENNIETINCENLENLSIVLLNKNQLTSFHGLDGCTNIQNLELSHNKITRIDLTSAIKWFGACYSLRELTLTGNPFLQEINWRYSLLKMLPALRILNGEMLNSYSESYTEEHYELELGRFLVLCQSQIREFNLLIENYITGKGNIFTMDAAENLCHYFKKLMTLSNEYRYAHEHGDGSITKKDESEAQQNHLAPTDSDSILQNRALSPCANECKPDSPDISEKWMNSGSSHSPLTNPSLCEDMEGRNQEKIVDNERENSKASSISTERIPLLETVITNSLLRNHLNIKHCEKTVAATVIQAYWRGYIVRRQIHLSTKLHTAATGPLRSWPNSYIKNQTILKKENGENTVNIQEQREKAAILIQAVWKGFLLRKKLTTALEAIKDEESEEEYEEIDLEDFTFHEFSATLNYDDTSLNLPSQPAQAWMCNEKENMFSSEYMQFNGRSREPELNFCLILLFGLDPTVRLALFKSNENKVSVTKLPKKTKPRRNSYFEGKEKEFTYKDTMAHEKLERSKEYTYQWLHTQIGVHETTSSRNMKCNHFLPELDPDVRNGGRVQLVVRNVFKVTETIVDTSIQ
ncbi:Leucine-rich repeat and IQ domain-containing protein 1 [Pteropus alecto]|uniref:Leucine-rich repeat and IQ domain-containing protein 1 n=1 Tax=Pteropus alecto TaxID=9402 RepID=L5JVN5_PTEAL|nr:Leucine-rich repeat and IQ domain-containing protein 1 [Pteropus alecto]